MVPGEYIKATHGELCAPVVRELTTTPSRNKLTIVEIFELLEKFSTAENTICTNAGISSVNVSVATK